MSAIASNMARPELPPADEELQDLYNQVLAGFADETFSPTALSTTGSSHDRELDSLVSAYSYSNDNAQVQDSQLNRTPSFTHGSQPVSTERSSSSSSQGRAPRRLPPLPGASSSSPSSASTSVMPEPRPYYETLKKPDNSSPSILLSSDPAINGYFSTGDGPRSPSKEYEYSTDFRYAQSLMPSSLRPASMSSTLANPPVSANEKHDFDPTNTWLDHTSPVRHNQNRNPGALSSRTPGQIEMPEPQLSMNDPYSNGYHDSPTINGRKIYSEAIRTGSPVPPPPPPKPAELRNLSFEDDSGPYHNNQSMKSRSTDYPTFNANRNNSIASSMCTNGDSVAVGRSSSIGTTVDGDEYFSPAKFIPTLEPSRHTFLDEKTALDFPDTEAPVMSNDSQDHLLHPEEFDEDYDIHDTDSEGDDRYVDFSLLSHIAMRLRDKVPRETHVKGSIPYPRAFTGKDIVSTIQSQIQRELLVNHGISTNDRRAALQVARSLQNQLFFYEVEWGGRALLDGVEDVYMFLDDQEGGSDARIEREELPTGVVTFLTKCYTPSCVDGSPCYAYSCPRRMEVVSVLPTPVVEVPTESTTTEWSEDVPPEILASLPQSEVRRQTIIRKVIAKEQQYIRDLDLVESIFILPLRRANPPVIRFNDVEDFIDKIFGNILDLRECNRRLLEVLYIRQREQGEVVSRIGDIFLDAAAEFRLAYPNYIGHLPMGEKTMKDEMESNAEFRLFLEQCSRHPENIHKLDLKHFLNRPSEHLNMYPVLFEAIQKETAEENPDGDFLLEAVGAMKNLQGVAQLRIFQTAMGKGPTGRLEWHSMVPEDVITTTPKQVAKRQEIIFELIKGEMAYVKDLENIEYMYVQPLRDSDPPIIPRERLDTFIHDVFHNFGELHAHHRRLLDQLHEIQREEHPFIRSVTAATYDAVLNFRHAYLEYIPNYPIAEYRIGDEMANNPLFKTFVEQCIRHSDAHRLDMKSFINRPIPRLLRYELLLKGILKEAPKDHDDTDAIPAVLDEISRLGKETEPGVESAKQKVELWRYNSNLVFKTGEAIDMDLLSENRSLIHTGKLLRQPETGFEWSGWAELFVLLFDNYMVMTKPKDKDGVTRYHVYRRPIPLDLLTLATFTDPPTQRGGGLIPFRGKGAAHIDGTNQGPTLSGSGGPETVSDARVVYPCTIHHNGRLGGLYTLFAETAQARSEWKTKLEEAIGLRKVVQESNKVFEVETLSIDTFLAPSLLPPNPSWNNDNILTGKVTCSVPFTTSDGRGLVAIGCAEGVWIGFRHDSRSMRRVLHLKMVTQCAMLEDFGIFLVLADKSLFAYHIEALVPTSPNGANATQTPQKLSGSKDVHFFSVGKLQGRTLVIYMKKKGLDSVFRVLEPVDGKITERVKAPASIGSRFGLKSQRSEWFRVYRDFFLPSESFDLLFLKAKIVILCTKGFEIMDLSDFKSVTIPQKEDPRLEKLAKRCESCQPMGMFRSNKDEFLLCYDEFGLYVDKHGDPSRRIGTVEWEGTAEHVAWHPPYVLLFDSRFIEIRHVETGRLVQIISGNDMRCIWDGRGTSSTTNTMMPTSDGGWEESVSQEPRVHGVMNIESVGPGRPKGALTQHVFELIPTVPLYLPGSLSAPSHASHFHQTNSPPHSPRLNPSFSFR